MITFPDDVLASYSRSKNYIHKTPLNHSPSLSELINGEVYNKKIDIIEDKPMKITALILERYTLCSIWCKTNATKIPTKKYAIRAYRVTALTEFEPGILE